MADALRQYLTQSDLATESPIEAMFARAFVMLSTERAAIQNAWEPFGITMACQQDVGPYRVDFLISRDEREVVVECDGHEYHERTKEQAARDKARDRYMTERGYAVMRFTGSEIWANPFACASQVLDFVLGRGGV